MDLPKLNKDDYLNHDYEFWKNYRKKLWEELQKEEQSFKDNPIEKTTENIYKMSEEKGVKPTARYFNISPKTVRYYREKYEKEREIL